MEHLNNDDEQMLEQFRLMAQAEANMRVKDNTGFVMSEYLQQQQQQQEKKNSNDHDNNNDDDDDGSSHLQFYYPGAAAFPQPQLPERTLLENNNEPNSSNHNHHDDDVDVGYVIVQGDCNDSSANPHNNVAAAAAAAVSAPAFQPREPTLPPRRANRRFVEPPRPPKVPELCEGTLVVDVGVGDTSNLNGQRGVDDDDDDDDDGNNDNKTTTTNTHIVPCMSCHSKLRVNVLASLVSCPKCRTVNPAMGPESNQ